MIRFLLCLAYPVLLVPLYLSWSRSQAEAQIDKMQRAVFNTPGAEAPLPPVVLIGGLGLMAGYGLAARILGLPGWQRFLAIALGLPLGVAVYSLRQAEQR
ncbi:MAG TPA: hypothetical protein VNK95_12470 [Caldilineaceae bacterium]|nr:hypothetical protein [Caldilineaceae bacterium]